MDFCLGHWRVPLRLPAVLLTSIFGAAALTASPAALAASSPSAYFSFNETSGTTAIDSAGGNHGTLAGATRIAGISGNAVSFAAAGQQVLAPDTAATRVDGSMTVTAWIRPDATTADRRAIAFKGKSWISNYNFGIERGMLVWSWSGGSHYYYSSPALKPGSWQHVAFTYDAASHAVTFYINGEAAGTGSETRVPQPQAGELHIGSDDSNHFFPGGIDEVRLYKEALSAADIRADRDSTQPPPGDTEPPGTPPNLVANGSSPSTIDLSWGAATDNVGVTGYLILRNGTAITTLAGTRWQDTGLAPDTLYQYAVHAVDAAGNRSAAATASARTRLPAGPVARFWLSSPLAQTMAPFAIGHAFRRGDVPAGQTVTAALPGFQATIKTRWPDGSAQFAILAGRTDLQAGVQRAVDLQLTATPGTVPAALTEGDLRTAGANAEVNFAGIGRVQLSELIGVAASYDTNAGRWSAGRVQTWISGPEMSSWIYSAPVGSDPSLTAWYEVRLWKGGRVEILPWLENGFLLKPGAAQKLGEASVAINGSRPFVQALDVRHHTRSPLVSGSTLSYWLGADPQVSVKHDVAYLQQSLLVPSYGVRTPATAPRLDTLPKTYTPFGQHSFPNGMGSPGYSPSIGLLPEWDVFHLTADADPRSYAAVIINGYAAGRYGLHYRDEKTHQPLRPSSYPNLVLNGTNAGVSSVGASTTNTYTPATAGAAPPVWASSHAPSVGYLAYLLSGRFYFMEQTEFAAMLVFLKQQNNVREFSKGVFLTNAGANTTRGAGWALRTVAQALAATPDDHPLKPELQALIDNNVVYYHGRYVAVPNHPQGVAQPYSDYTAGDGKYMHAAWMEDFLTAAFGYTLSLGQPSAAVRPQAEALFRWKAQSIVGRLGEPGPDNFDFRDAAQYTLAVAPSDTASWGANPGPWYANWGDIYRATVGSNAGTAPPNTLRGAYFPEATSYWGNLQPAIAYAVALNVPGAREAYSRMTGAANWPQFLESAKNQPVWAVVPPAMAPADTTPPRAPTHLRY